MRLQSLASARVEGALVAGGPVEGPSDARFSPRTLGVGRLDYSQAAASPLPRGRYHIWMCSLWFYKSDLGL
jgi:hypothetical protein